MLLSLTRNWFSVEIYFENIYILLKIKKREEIRAVAKLNKNHKFGQRDIQFGKKNFKRSN